MSAPPENAEGEAPAEGDAPQARPANKRLQQTQAQVDEVVEVMKMNLEKVIERDTKLAQLDDRADALQEGASQFQKSANTLKDKMWWKNMKMTLIMIAVGLIVIFVLFGQYIFPSGVPGVGGAGGKGAVATGGASKEEGADAGKEKGKEEGEGGPKKEKGEGDEKGKGDKDKEATETDKNDTDKDKPEDGETRKKRMVDPLVLNGREFFKKNRLLLF